MGYADAAVSLAVGNFYDYLYYKRQNLILPMITDVKPWHDAETEAASGRTWLSALAIYFLVR